MTIPEQDQPLLTAYERYAEATAAHVMVWNNPKSTQSERFASAMSVHSAFHDFLNTYPKAGPA